MEPYCRPYSGLLLSLPSIFCLWKSHHHRLLGFLSFSWLFIRGVRSWVLGTEKAFAYLFLKMIYIVSKQCRPLVFEWRSCKLQTVFVGLIFLRFRNAFDLQVAFTMTQAYCIHFKVIFSLLKQSSFPKGGLIWPLQYSFLVFPVFEQRIWVLLGFGQAQAV